MTQPFRMMWFGNYAARNWDLPDIANYGLLSPAMYAEAARIIERRGLFDAIVFADVSAIPTGYDGTTGLYIKKGLESVCMGDPVTVIAALSAATERLGLVSTMSTMMYTPELLAQTVGTLDHLTGGRVGWNIVTSQGADAARNYGMENLPGGDTRYDLADGFVARVRHLWGTAATAPGAAELKMPPLPQGQPVFMQAGGSERGRTFAAEHAELVIAHRNTTRTMRAFRDDMRARMARVGRDPDSCKFFFSVKLVLGETRQDAEATYARQKNRPANNVEAGLAYFSHRVGVNIADLALDEPLPPGLTGHGSAGLMQQHTGGDGAGTLRQIAEAEAIKESYLALGTAEEVAEQLCAAMEEVGGDGFAVRETFHPSLVVPAVDRLMPALRRRGVARTGYRHATFRENLLDPAFHQA